MRAQEVPSGHGWLWIKQGFGLFRKAPLMWWVFLSVWFLVYVLFKALLGDWGDMAFGLIYPALSAGLMLGCRAQESDKTLELAYLITGFKKNFKQLLMLGLITLITGFIISWLMSLIFPLQLEKLKSLENANADLRSLLPGILQLMAIQMLASTPIFIAVWFAPALLIFHDEMSAGHAIRWSFYACIANIGAFGIYGLISLGLFILASLPLGLGLIVVIPMLVASSYTSYRDIFVDTPEPSEDASTN